MGGCQRFGFFGSPALECQSGNKPYRSGCGVTTITIQAIFFDFDGVIVDSAEIKIDAFRELYKAYPVPVIEKVVAYHKAHEGVSRVVKIRHAHMAYLGVDLTPEAHDRLCREYAGLVEQQVVECESVEGALDYLKRAAGHVKSFVVSGTPEDELRRITDKRQISNYFTGIFGSPRKKEDIVNEQLAVHGLTADKCLFIGDAMTDYNAAQACRMPFLGRVIEGEKSPFPKGTDEVPDLTGLAHRAGLLETSGAQDG